MLAAVALLSVALAAPGERYLCNYAKIVGPRSVPVIAEADHKAQKTANLPRGSVVYVCDERGTFVEVYFGTLQNPCARPSPQGLDVRLARRCRSGWVRRGWVEVLSG
jgi:hypothetical protein